MPQPAADRRQLRPGPQRPDHKPRPFAVGDDDIQGFQSPVKLSLHPVGRGHAGLAEADAPGVANLAADGKGFGRVGPQGVQVAVERVEDRRGRQVVGQHGAVAQLAPQRPRLEVGRPRLL